jgi:hypothetical protein
MRVIRPREAPLVKKLPIIGLIIGAIAAGWALMRRKKSQPDDDMAPGAGTGEST